MRKAGILIRVSTEEQDYTNQLFHLEEICKHRGYEIYKIYSFKESAYKPQSTLYLKEPLEDARLGKIDTLFIWSLDRLSRRGVNATLNILRDFSKYNVQVVSHKENWIETFTHEATRELLISLISFVAKFESDRKSDRVQVAMDKLKAEGKPRGRPKGSKDKGTRQKTGYIGNNNRNRNKERVKSI